MWIQFLLEHVHFSLHLLAALVFFAVFWLYLDAWQIRRESKEFIKLVGFFLLSCSFVLESVVIEAAYVSTIALSGVSVSTIAHIVRTLGYVTICYALLADPLQDEPKRDERGVARALASNPGFISTIPTLLAPIASSIVSVLFLRRSTVGLEDHLKPLSYAFGLLAISELFGMAVLFRQTPLVSVHSIVQPFGVFWILSLGAMTGAVLILARWVFGYLLKQFQAQIFMVYTATILVVFLLTTISFTGLLLKNMESESLRQIETDAKVLDFAVSSQKDQSIADAQSLAVDPQIIAAIAKADRKTLGDIATSHLVAKKLYTFLIVSESGQVLARGEDRDRVGDSLSSDALLKRSLFGQSLATIVSTDGVVSPELSIRAASPIRKEDQTIVGAIYIGRSIDSAFVDGMKKATGLDASIYGDNTVSATTFLSQDGRNRMTGMREEHDEVQTTVLSKGLPYSGSLVINGTLYTSAFLPLKNVDNNPIGMLYVGKPQLAILQAAGASIQYTFLITALLMVLSIFPAYFVSRYIAEQL